MIRLRWSPAPSDITGVQRRNFINVQVDAVGVGLASAAAPFLPVYLTLLGASNFQVGLLSAMPAVTGLVMALVVGRFLQTRRSVVPWFSLARLLVISAYAATGLVTWLVPTQARVGAVLGIWALVTLPQVVVAVAFSVVMNAVAGPNHRYELMSRRWSILGLTTALTATVVGQVLDRISFPFNYQTVFMALSAGGLISFYFSSHINLPDSEPPPSPKGKGLSERLRDYFNLVLAERDFVRFSIQRFFFLSGVSLGVPLFPLYYVREVQASNAWIGIISTAQTAVLLVGYFIWTRGSRRKGSRFVLLWTTFGVALYPALVALTHRVELIAVYAGLAGIFQAGLDLVFFDELMKTVPPQYSATFVSLAQSLQHLAAIFSPLIGTWLAGQIGLGGALVVAAAVRFSGFILFALWQGKPASLPAQSA